MSSKLETCTTCGNPIELGGLMVIGKGCMRHEACAFPPKSDLTPAKELLIITLGLILLSIDNTLANIRDAGHHVDAYDNAHEDITDLEVSRDKLIKLIKELKNEQIKRDC